MKPDDLDDGIASAWRWLMAIAIVVLGTLGAASLREYRQLGRVTAEVEAAQRASADADELVMVLVDAETGYRGYLLTANPAFLEPYRDIDARARAAIVSLASRLSSLSGRQAPVSQLSAAVDAVMKEMATRIEQFQRGDKEGAIARVASGDGKRLMDQVRLMAAALKADQRSLADEGQVQAAAAATTARRLAVVTVLVALIMAGLAWSLNRTFETRRRAFAAETMARLEAGRDAAMAARNLQDSESFNRSILDNSGDCISVLTRDGVVTLINRSGVRLLQLAEDGSWLNTPWARLWPGHEDVVGAAVQHAFEDNEGRFVASRVGTDGDVRWWDVIITPVRSLSGQVTQLVATARDVSGQKRAEEERSQLLASERAARSEAERSTRLKDEFVATLSHELRAPLNAILGWVSVLKKDRSDDTLSKAVEVIERSSRRQSQMIDDLLDLGRILSGKMRLDVQRVDLAAVIEEAALSARPSAEAKGVRLLTALGTSAIVRGDHGRLQQVVWNLLSNAIKFTGRGGQVQVTVKNFGSQVLVEVSDSGIGIAPDLLPRVFDRFSQADSSATRRQGGLGIGLSIVKNLVELHGGVVEASSAGENAGSTFTVRLPLALAGPTTEVAGAAFDALPLAPDILTGLHVLVVDDEEDAREVVTRLLHDAGAIVSAAGSAREGLEIIGKGMIPDVVVSDVGMPEHDGYEFIQSIRRGGGGASAVPAVALTALARLEDRKRALLAGFQTHLAKPVDPAELVVTVASLGRRTGRS